MLYGEDMLAPTKLLGWIGPQAPRPTPAPGGGSAIGGAIFRQQDIGTPFK